MGALHIPPAKPSELQRFVRHLEGALEARLEACDEEFMSPFDALTAFRDALIEARKEMGW
jgi:hypothetical protein